MPTPPDLVGGKTADGRRAVSITEAGALLGINRSGAYRSAAKGEIPTIRVGGRVLVPVAALERLLDGDPT